ncbi:DUF6215 domain-containing protein [Streptomyces sp. NPDC059786]|uniref:DUF6215 domain-containing protein n=1 Tax=Streptomyces sp. NPDC059786 TaxID=3346946 RepID=UPI00364ACF3F
MREPLLIAVGSVFGVRIMYLAIRDHEGVAAVIGLVFLVGTAVRVHTVVKALRARRNRTSTASAGGPTAEPAEAAPAATEPAATEPQPSPDPARTSEKEPNAWGQALAAVALVGGLAAVFWLAPRLMPSDDSTAHTVSCPSGEQDELPSVYRKKPRPVTGAELCEALNRPDLAELLGTPEETATGASATSNTAPLTDGKIAQPEAEVTFDTYTVHASATYNELSTAQYVKLMKYGDERDVRTLTVLGRPAVLSSDHTMKLEIDLGGGASGGPVEEGPLARTLSVALDHDDRGGYCEITVWSTSGTLPDDQVLLDIAEKVFPTIDSL